MSFWIFRKDGKGKSSVYSVTIPYEMIMIIIGLIGAFFLPRYLRDPVQLGMHSFLVALVGFALLFFSKISLFRRGIWNSWGSKLMKRPFKWLYNCGYALMAAGILGGILFAMTGN